MRISDWSSDVCSSDLDVAQVAADRGRGVAGAGTAHDPRRLGEALLPQLADDRLGDVVVAAPVGGALGQAELVEEAGAARGDFPCARLRAGVGAGEFAVAAERVYGLDLRSEEHKSELQSLMRL